MVIEFLEKNNFPVESNPSSEAQKVNVAILGFDTQDDQRLRRVFQLERLNQRKYFIVDSSLNVGIDILLVNFDSPAAVSEKEQILNAQPQIQLVAVSRGSLIDAPTHHIRGMLIAARVLSEIDKIFVKSIPENSSTWLHGDQVLNSQKIEEKAEPHRIIPELGMQLMPDGYRALVVDDSPAIQKSLQINLANLPQISVIDFAINGESALEKAGVQQYDLIFLDVMMPGIDGYETCARLRKKQEYKKTPIVMVSGKTSPLDEVKGVMSGCTTYLTKPVQTEAFQQLSSRILVWLERQRKS
jgi:CheY-like chemotaxis protein